MDPRAYVSSPIRLDLIDERLWVDDEPVRLGPKPFALLRALMATPQQLITKDALIETVWDGRAVSDAVLTTAMRELRRALDDDARTPTFIETVHGRGYRFLNPVMLEAESPTSTTPVAQQTHTRAVAWNALNQRRRLGFAGLVVSVVLVAFFWRGGDPPSIPISPVAGADHVSVAVLPFEDLSAEQNQAYFADGLALEILNVLVRVEGLDVAPRSASFAFGARPDATPSTIGEWLSVRHLLRGSVRKAGDRVRVTVSLLDVQSANQIWSETFDRRLTVENILEIQDEIAIEVLAQLEGAFGADLVAPQLDRVSAAAGTTSLAAYEAYLEAHELFIARSDPDRAIALARAATQTDDRFARAWELLAATAFVRRGQPTAEAQNAAARALLLDPNLSLAHAIQGVMGNINPPYDWSRAVASLERAIELDPNNTSALLWLGVEMRKLGYLDRARVLFERCLEIDPKYTRCRYHMMWALHMLGDSDEAILAYRQLVADGAPPDDAVLLLEALSRNDLELADLILNSFRPDEPLPAVVYAALQSQDRESDAAAAALESWLANERFNHKDVYTIIMFFERYDLLWREQGSFFGLWLPEFPEYRQSESFETFVKFMRIDVFWRDYGYPPQCRAEGEDGFVCGDIRAVTAP